jgi:hypothetical protein
MHSDGSFGETNKNNHINREKKETFKERKIPSFTAFIYKRCPLK